MTRIAGDSTTVADIPLDVDIAAVYFDGSYATTIINAESRFPGDKYGLALIDVTGQHPLETSVLDVENGDATPAMAASWIDTRRRHGDETLAVIYCNRSTVDAVDAACSADGFKRGVHYGLWIATLDGTEVEHHEGDGIVACQRDSATQTGGHWDRSLVYDDNIWRPATPPAPPAPPKVTLAEALAALTTLGRYLDGK